MTKLKTLSAIALISAAIATPVFAQDAIGPDHGLKLKPVTNYRLNYRRARTISRTRHSMHVLL